MSRKIHDQFIEISQEISSKLTQALIRTGPVKFKRRNEKPLPDTLCRVVAGQQLSTKAAASIWEKVVKSAGRKKLINHIKKAEIEELRACGLSNAKAKTMKAIIQAHEDGLLNEAQLKRMKHPERSERLTTIWGIGQWTADMTGIFYFGDKNIWPSGDNTVSKIYQSLTTENAHTGSSVDRFQPYRTYLAMYMYQIAKNPTL